MKKFYKILSCLILLITIAIQTYAGGTPVRKGKYVISGTFSYFTSTQAWDQSGKAADYANNGFFNSGGVAVYGEYGASRRVTLIASLPYSYNTYGQNSGKTIAQGVGDAEVGARFYLGNLDFKFYMAFQSSIVIPLYNNQSTNLGFGAYGADFKLIGSGSAPLGGERTFIYSLEAGGRQYFNETGPFQLRSTASVGIGLDKANTFSLGSSGVLSTSSNKSFSNNILINKDFKYLNASASFGHTFSPMLSVYVNYTRFFIGTNTGIGNNTSLTFITRF